MDFSKVYSSLNSAQKEAVDTIDGPLLVVAGPGTGKTQLLSARVANILKNTDTLPHNILCLTFTESGATNMRERLSRFIGPSAYDVTISTYHAFGGDIINRFSDYFDDRLETPIDNLRKHQIIEQIVANLSFRDPLKQTRHHLRDLIGTISEIKRALLTPEDIRRIAKENEKFILQTSGQISSAFNGLKRMPSKVDRALPYFLQTLTIIESEIPDNIADSRFGCLAQISSNELREAVVEANSAESTKPLTSWKDRWLAKNSLNQFVMAGDLENRRLKSLASVLESYQTALASGGFYDFDDMILRAIHALETNDDLRFTLQEQYLYILLDEYQDTNAAQSRLVQLLTDNPVSEGRPNVMAVGDDDQAIYAFQGAQYSNMLDFYRHYRDTRLINLSENYRSHADILKMAENIAKQIDERLFHQFDDATKDLVASNPNIKSGHIERRDFKSRIAENSYVATRIKALIEDGVPASEIAVLTPKHSLLENFVAYANAQQIPIHYEKRENILQSPIINQLLTMSKLSLMLKNNDSRADSLWPEVLSYDFFNLPVSKIWQLGWQVNDYNAANRDVPTSWVRQMTTGDDEQLKNIGLFFLALGSRADNQPYEVMLDYMIGLRPVPVNEPDNLQITSPLFEYLQRDSSTDYYDTLSNLTVLRSKLREYQAGQPEPLMLPDLIVWTDAYKAAGEHLLNTSPYHQASESVQLMTVFKSKGLEFSHVFLLAVDDSTWGSSGKSSSNKLTLPKNLAPIRHSGATEDERLRLLFVALTRAKTELYMTSSSADYSGKATKRLKYLDEREDETGAILSHAIPTSQSQVVLSDDTELPPVDNLLTNWQSRHATGSLQSDLRQLLSERIANYKLSASDLNKFTNLKYGGPQKLLLENLLGFRGAANIDSIYGNTIHATLKWLQQEIARQNDLPSTESAITRLKYEINNLKITEIEKQQLIERGSETLSTFLDERGANFKPTDKAEVSFKYENVRIGDAHLTGTIDRLEIDEKTKTITIVDFKTGAPKPESIFWYSRQLYFYKFLVEQSRAYKSYTVTGGRLEYVEPDSAGELPAAKIVIFKASETDELKKLIEVVWRKIQSLDFPDVTQFAESLAGSKQFEKFLTQPQELTK